MEASEFFQRLHRRTLPVVLDDAGASRAVSALGFEVTRIEDYDFGRADQAPALVVLTAAASIGRLHALWGKSAARFCHLALAKFDASPECLAYAFAQLLAMDPGAALARRAATYDRLVSCQDVEIVTRAGPLRCHLGEALEIPNAGSTLEPGWLYSIAEFFEASVVNLESERSTFWVEGELTCDALIYLCNSAEQKARFAPVLDALLREVAAHGATLRFVDNRLERFAVGGEDRSTTLLALTEGQEREAAATELGFGCAEFPIVASFERNSVLHKSRLGAYVGIGKGHLLPHIDFVASGADIHFIPSAEAT